MSQNSYFTDGKWTFKRIGRNIWKIYLTKNPYSITMTGSAVTTQLHIPFAHRWLRMHLYHTDSSYATSVNNLSVTLKRAAGTVHPLNKFEEYLFSEDYVVSSKVTEVYGEGFEYEAGVYSLILNTVTTELIFPIFYVQKLEA